MILNKQDIQASMLGLKQPHLFCYCVAFISLVKDLIMTCIFLADSFYAFLSISFQILHKAWNGLCSYLCFSPISENRRFLLLLNSLPTELYFSSFTAILQRLVFLCLLEWNFS